jgi:ribosomal protein S18 acetylase RimI-like enzyme
MRAPSADSFTRSTPSSAHRRRTRKWFAELRFRPSLYTGALDAYLEELYVVPERRGHGLGRALLEAAMEAATERGAAHIDVGTSEDDAAARSLYESAGFTNREGGPDGPRMLYYERDL